MNTQPHPTTDIPDFLNRKTTPPPMPDEHRRRVLAMTKDEALRVWDLCHIKYPNFPGPIPSTDDDPGATAKALLLRALANGNGQKDLVLSLSRGTSPTEIRAIEKLLDHPIKRPQLTTSKQHADRARAAKSPRKQTRNLGYELDSVIVHLVPNPKRPDKEPWMRYNLYRLGMSAQAALDAGVTHGDVLWDLAHSYIKLSPKDQAP